MNIVSVTAVRNWSLKRVKLTLQFCKKAKYDLSILVDDGSDRWYSAGYRQICRELEVLYHKEPRRDLWSRGRAYNYALSALLKRRADIVSIIDGDVLPETNQRDIIEKEFQSQQGIFLVGSVRNIFSFPKPEDSYENAWTLGTPRFSGPGALGMIAMRVEDFASTLYDEEYKVYGAEDWDLAARLQEKHLKLKRALRYLHINHPDAVNDKKEWHHRNIKLWESKGLKIELGSSKPRILLVPDSPGWAFDFRCNALVKELDVWYDFEKVYWKDMPDIDYSKFDLVYYAGFYMIGSPKDKAKGIFKKEQITTSVPGLVTWTSQQAIPYVNKSIAFSVLNPILRKEFEGKVDSELFLIPNGVDVGLFRRIPHSPNKVFTLGWAGQHRHWGKRLEELTDIAKRIPNVNFLAQKKDQIISHEKMPEFYNKLDCYCCASISEGSNNPMLEAAACGVPVISTWVGVAPDMLCINGVPQADRGILVKDDLSDLKEAIIRVRDYPLERREKIGATLRQRIINGFTWKNMAYRYKKMFEYALGKNRERKNGKRE